MFILLPFSEKNWKLWNLHFYPKFSKSWIHHIALVWCWIINDLTNNVPMMVWYKHKFEIFGADHQLFGCWMWKTFENKWWDFILKKARTIIIRTQDHQTSLKQCFFTSLIEIWLFTIRKKRWMIWGQKYGFLRSQKNFFLKKKNVLLETVHVTPRYLLI